jgi:hypothetical protein
MRQFDPLLRCGRAGSEAHSPICPSLTERAGPVEADNFIGFIHDVYETSIEALRPAVSSMSDDDRK